MNAVVVAVVIMLGLSLARVNVVLALFMGAIVGGVTGGLGALGSLESFGSGLGNGASIALSYALLGAFAMAISRSGIPDYLAGKIITIIHNSKGGGNKVKYNLLLCIILMAVASQNLVPVHIAFIPILIPPLLAAFSRLKLDRRLVACCLTFGLTATYMLLPVGFGNIYMIEILANNLRTNGLEISNSVMPQAMMIPVGGMFLGLLVAVFWTYRNPRDYRETESKTINPENVALPTTKLIGIAAGIGISLAAQLWSGSMSLGALAGCLTLIATGVINYKEADEVFVSGMKMMAYCGFIMISAAGFAEVMRATGDVNTLVSSISELFAGNTSLGVLMMLIVGLLITMGIGSSFSTVPIIATLYVPLGMEMGLSALAIAALVGTAGALGDAGSPASDSTIGPTAGLNVDGQHDHIRDSVLPTFIHYNIPLVLFGWLAVMVL
ncbi:sodium:proton antiporter [Sansalvadorimonas sp. 2012CJ34-2]|uniref:Sodium:proton antiporter n=1 Tax=Parendozoicomonas callyspongiae TaxID=2942213 RepID=A0ABT0PBV1_9GAMM|nr:Na+/H+ antiporter NhaC family protein [Sansalvadorimonas sp. 2012CJ34-2]MCL6268860.1 sodium:proton antiporter [Sansalvadorimonas sp. 2012CJ34-2]